MPEDVDPQEAPRVTESRFEAYAYSSDIFPHPSILEGYQNAIPDGGKEVITILKRQQTMTFVYSMASLVTNNLIAFILILPILIAISSGAIIQITVVSAVPISLYTAGSAVGRVLTTWRGGGAAAPPQLSGPSEPAGQGQLPPDSR